MMIAALIAMALAAPPSDSPGPTIADPSTATRAPSPAARAEAARRKQARARLRALNARRLAAMNAPDWGSGWGDFGGTPADGGVGSPFDRQLASTYAQARDAMARGQAAISATAGMT